MGANKDLKKIKKQLKVINKTLCDLIRYVTADNQMQVGGFKGHRPWDKDSPGIIGQAVIDQFEERDYEKV